jgi:hypothetical protein
VGETDAYAIDTAVGAGKNFEAETVFYNYLARERNVAGDLGDEPAQGGGFVMLGQAEGGGVVPCVSLGAVRALVLRVGVV